METLIVLLGVFVITLLFIKLISKKIEIFQSARIAMAVMLVFTAVSHFVFTKGMAMMVSFLPWPTAIVYATGIIELMAAVGLLIPKTRVLTAKLLIVFFIVLLPANIYAAAHSINLQTANYSGKGISYLWFRIPLQLLFISWVYFSFIKKQPGLKGVTAS
ncbi:DoxX family protein [Flavobacterium tructae]|uniref:DoxX family membrane protein n=1 Tax=Flavobacterium tructae TaxID=1114873 RepID=A0A1S1J5Y1_9FLAO|nr:hypothetical protein [Flavobacterium tructae]OHT45200.1 hypothetical protein BHE19_10905 [Flavobacterium tructae]OXB16449.1 hypothetical protein B0A71_18390 [Flavobacterium tructae]